MKFCICVAVTGFISAVIGEILTGRGALGQLQLETRLPQTVINLGVVGIVVRTRMLTRHTCCSGHACMHKMLLQDWEIAANSSPLWAVHPP